MKLRSKSIAGAVAVASLSTLASTAGAYEKGDWLLRLGWAEVAPNSGSDPLEADGVPVTGKDVIEVGNDYALGISATYMFNSYLGLELLASTPFEHNIYGTGELEGINLGNTTHLPPTLTLQWYPVGNRSAWQPYLGAGINFTWFISYK